MTTTRMDSALEGANNAMVGVEDAVKTLREAIVAERCEPHPSQRLLADLEELMRDVIGKMHWIASQLHGKGAHTFAAELRRAAHSASARKAAILGESYAPTKHSVSLSIEKGKHGVSCLCGWSAGGFGTAKSARDYGNAHIRVAAKGEASNGDGKKAQT